MKSWVVTIVISLVSAVLSGGTLQIAMAKQNSTSITPTNSNVPATNAKQAFHSAFDIFVVPGSVKGYGMYQSHNSSIFKPGEEILLYIEPVGYSYKPTGSLFLMNFTADVVV